VEPGGREKRFRVSSGALFDESWGAGEGRGEQEKENAGRQYVLPERERHRNGIKEGEGRLRFVKKTEGGGE